MGKKATKASPENRTEQGRFQSGVSGNPGGRPKGLAVFREKMSIFEADTFVQLGHMISNAADDRVRLEAIKHVHAYLYGKPTQAVEVSGPDGEAMKSETKVSHAATGEDFAAALKHALGAGILVGAAGLLAPSPQPEADEVCGAGPDAGAEGVPSP